MEPRKTKMRKATVCNIREAGSFTYEMRMGETFSGVYGSACLDSRGG